MAKSVQRSIGTRLKAYWRDDRGIGAIEFAFVFPLLLILYIGAFELTVAFSMYKRTANAAGAIADIVSQQDSVNTAFLASTAPLAAAIYTPYRPASLQIKITGINVDANNVPRIQWSWSNDGTAPYQQGAVVALPQGMRESGRFFVRSELSLPHSIMRYLASNETEMQVLTLHNEDVFEKRGENPISCSDCATLKAP